MASLTNAYTASIGLPDGRVLPPGGTAEKVDAATLKHPVIVARIEAGDLKQDGAAEEEQDGEVDGELDKLSDDELRVFLSDRGVFNTDRWQRKRLLAEAGKVKAAA